MGRDFSLEPVAVERVETRFRRIVTSIPAPESVPVLEALRRYEPRSMRGQPPILWDRAEGFQVYDAYGNVWLDWTSGVLVANAGHSAPEVCEAIKREVERGLLHTFAFPNAARAALVQYLASITPPGLDKVSLFTTGAEAVENAIKLARTWGQRVGGRQKNVIVSFERAFHGRTLGAQMAGGLPPLKAWIANLDPDMQQVPFPDGFRTEDTSFDLFRRTLAEKGVTPDRVAAVMAETYQGGGSSFAPREYMQALASWCREHGALLIYDEIQAGFGRTGTLFGFEHYGVVPDLFCCGKGISSSLPLSAVIGRAKILDLYDPGDVTSTHSGNPVSAAAALASLRRIVEGGLVENAARMGARLFDGLRQVAAQHADVVGALHGRGLVGGLHIVRTGTREPDGDLAIAIVEQAFRRGLLMFAPVGVGGASVKIAPPLTVTADAIDEGVSTLSEAIVAARAAQVAGS